MPVKFQSSEHFEAVNEALANDEAVAGAAKGHDVSVQVVTVDGPNGEVKSFLKITGGKPEVGMGTVEKPDATITQNYETAVALDKGELNAQNAFMQGKIKIQGNLMKMMKLQGFLQSLAPAVSHIEREY